jgi:signal transduction histidine kinase
VSQMGMAPATTVPATVGPTVTSPYLLALAASFAVVVALVALTRRRIAEPGAREFLLLLCVTGAWQATTLASMVVADRGVRLALEKLTWLYPVPLSVAWLAFALAYTGEGRVRPRWAAALLVPGMAVQPVVWLAPTPLAWSGVEYVTAGGIYLVNQASALLSWTLFGYTGALTLLGGGLLLRFGVTARHLYWDQTAALGLGAVVPVLVSVPSITDLTPIPGLNLTPYAFGVSALLFGNALFRYGFFDHVPATRQVGTSAVTDHIRDGVVVVDDEDRIVRANPVAEAALGDDERALLGTRFRKALPESARDEAAIGERAVYRSPADGRAYELDETPLTDQHDRTIGRVLLLRDVTGRENREQRLAVLNRTLRHNLRNEMNIVEGYAGQLADECDGDRGEMAETVREVAADLIDLSKKTRDAEAVMASRGDDPETAHLGELLERAVAAVDGDAAVDLRAPSDVSVPATDTFRAVVYNAVENAVVHGDPPVRVRVEGPDDGRVSVVVADEGPGIPEPELSVIEDGVETQLEHGSGLGLWIIAWGTRSLGGEADFETGPAGTTVTVTVPAAAGADGPGLDPDDEPESAPARDGERGDDGDPIPGSRRD